jgi:hypothetical protein
LPPTFIIFVVAAVYVPLLATMLAVSGVLLIHPRTRSLGKRLAGASLATAPALGASAGGAAVTGAGLRLFLGVVLRPWTAGVEHPALTAIVGFGFVAALVLGALFVIVSVVCGGYLGWIVAGAGSIRAALERNAVVQADKNADHASVPA